ncbi:MAG: ABC transporter ATP-binding protein [Candidatus Poribacteria bacterium]|nr:ABC transporter ATP-binding protein [Candidatus Poribacteria bacterium]
MNSMGRGFSRRDVRRMAHSSGKRNSAKRLEEEMTILEQVPPDLQSRLKDVLSQQEEIKVAISTDLQFDGTYGKDWVLVTEKRLIAFNRNGAPTPEVQNIPLEDVESIEIRELHGNNIMKVRTQAGAVEVARYSKRFAPKFAEATPEIESLIDKVKPEALDESKRHRKYVASGKKIRCETCGSPIPRRSDVCPNCVEKGKLIFRLLKYALPFWRVSAPAVLIMMVVRLVDLYPAVLSKQLIDDIFVPATQAITNGQQPEPGAFGQLVLIVLLMVGVNVFTMVASAIRGYMMAWVGQNITLKLRNDAYQHLSVLSLDFYEQRDTGNLMSRITQDVGRLRDFISEGLQNIIGDSMALIYMCIIMFAINWQLALWALIPIPLLIFFTIFFGQKMHKVFHVLWKHYAGISTILASTIPGVRVVKAFTREKYEVGRFRNLTDLIFEGEMNAAKLWTVYHPIMRFIIFFGMIMIWLVGGRQILNDQLTIGGLTLFTNFMMRFFMPVQTLCRMNERFLRAATSAERVFEILDTPPSVADSKDAIDLPDIRGAVEFRDVVFSYDSEKNALNGINFTVKPGEMIGLVGHSGAGKSTLINLITRFYDPQHGEVFIDGHDTRDVKVSTLRKQIGVVLQDPFLFEGTVADNIGYGKPDATRKEIIAAAKAANAHDFIVKFPDGYDTKVGERGSRVSGGERQRISIARAILKNPRILILDEATSSVDTETESRIQEALGRLIQGRTVFAIAHRLSTLKHSNRLIILEEGKVDEIGTHEELIAKGGTYAGLCEKQMELSKIRAL